MYIVRGYREVQKTKMKIFELCDVIVCIENRAKMQINAVLSLIHIVLPEYL